MNSLDTNILYYATNADCREHAWARPVLEELLAAPNEWIIADQVLWEYYRLVRNPSVVARPLGAAAAAQRLRFFREEAGCMHCGYDIALWPQMAPWLERAGFPASRTFDLVLAVTLRAAGVTRFLTRNAKDFEAFGFFEVVNPEVSGAGDRGVARR
jgi:toxin-antitoxin system PIN domain toxin